MNYLDRLSAELAAVGITGRPRARIVAEARDHLAEGDEERFGDAADLARQFADGLAVHRSRRAAFVAFGALAAAGAGFSAMWLAVASGTQDIAAGRWAPLGVAAALGTIVFPQVAFAAGVLALLRALRLRGAAAKIALLLTRTRVALVFGALALASVGVYGIEFRLAAWVPVVAGVLLLPLGVAAGLTRGAAAVKSSVPGEAGDVFDDLPVRLPRRYGLLCAVTAGVAALATFAAAPGHEGVRNAVAEVIFVTAGWLALGRRLGLRR
jgi:hypothetical protein